MNPTKPRDREDSPKPESGKPPSDRRAAANRANARKSTGPRTVAGRARSRMNALKHGLCARVVLLPGEDWREYQAFADEFTDDLKPRGVIQEMLAGRAAALAWALQRLPDAASELAERGEGRRFSRWFDGRGLGQKFDVLFSREGPGTGVPRSSRQDLHEVADAELAIARSQGNPAPDDRDAAGIVADALAGDDAFAAILKLEEHERRLWSALLSVLRALERRQKIDGRGEGNDGVSVGDRDEDPQEHAGETSGDDAPRHEVVETGEASSAAASTAAPTVEVDESTKVQTGATDSAPENPAASDTERAVDGNDTTADESGASAPRDIASRGSTAMRRGVAPAPEQQRAPARNEANVEHQPRVRTEQGADNHDDEPRSDDPPRC